MNSSHKNYDIIVIGGGAYGLSSAWHLLKSDANLNILVLDANDFGANGTGRCVGGVRTLWGHQSNIKMCQESVTFFEESEERLRYPGGVEFKQKGYLMLSWEPETLELYESLLPLQHELNVPSEILSHDEVLELSPLVNPENLLGGVLCRKDGALNPFRWMDGLLKDIRNRGGTVQYGERVADLKQHKDQFEVATQKNTYTSKKLLLCTDWAAPDLANLLGVKLPVERVPVECMVTERWPQILGPNHLSMRHDMAINQLANGSIVINHGRAREKLDDISNQPDWFERACSGALAVVPGLANINVLRAWAGTISVTPDMQPIICETPLKGLFTAISAYKGLMTSPAAGRMIADLILGKDDDPVSEFVHLDRFESGNPVREPMTNGAKLD